MPKSVCPGVGCISRGACSIRACSRAIGPLGGRWNGSWAVPWRRPPPAQQQQRAAPQTRLPTQQCSLASLVCLPGFSPRSHSSTNRRHTTPRRAARYIVVGSWTSTGSTAAQAPSVRAQRRQTPNPAMGPRRRGAGLAGQLLATRAAKRWTGGGRTETVISGRLHLWLIVCR